MSAYSDAVRMLARRELSEAQIRQRLARRDHSADAIDAAVERLREQRAIDDTRVAEAIARTQILSKRRWGPRAEQYIVRAGISRETARRVAREVTQSVDPDTQIEAALAKRLRGREPIADDKQLRRLYRYLVGQGYETDRIIRVLRSRMPSRSPLSER